SRQQPPRRRNPARRFARLLHPCREPRRGYAKTSTTGFGWLRTVVNFSFDLIACCSIVVRASRSACSISVASLLATRLSLRQCTVISARCRYLSSLRTMWALVQRLVTRSILARPSSASCFSLDVIAVLRPVYSTIIRHLLSLRSWMSTIVLDVGAWRESAYLRDTSPPCVESPEYPASAIQRPTARR